MARYTGPACKLCRREGTKLFLKGAQMHRDTRQRKTTDIAFPLQSMHRERHNTANNRTKVQQHHQRRTLYEQE